MRLFNSLRDAGLEIKRDLFKGADVKSSRVQQKTNLYLTGKERFGYDYAIDGQGFPLTAHEVVQLGIEMGFPHYSYENDMKVWLEEELMNRVSSYRNSLMMSADHLHPALATTIEGSWPAYTYRERLQGAVEFLAGTLIRHPDTRRAYWSIFRPEDTMRAQAPTRIPCSLGYHFVIRSVNNFPTLMMIYYQRSADFMNFWLSDIWLAFMFAVNVKNEVADKAPRDSSLVDLRMGPVMHFISSFHLFLEGEEEIY